MAFPSGIPSDFHKYFASWVRIEPRCRADDVSEGIQARIADPLWMLARQWQVGEFQAEDAGSAVRVTVKYRTAEIETAVVGTEAIALGGAPPVETLVEREPVRVDPRLRVRLGQQFERLIRSTLAATDHAAVLDVYRQAFPLSMPAAPELALMDASSRRFLRLVSGRTVDGVALLAADAGDLPDRPATVAASQATLNAIIARLRDWAKQWISEPGAPGEWAWNSGRLHYSFALQSPEAGDAPTALASRDHRTGELDWYSCRFDAPPTNAWETEEKQVDAPPTRVSFAGMPDHRWWAFENNRVDFGALDVATPDLAKLMLMEFALVYGDDWLLVPIEMPRGCFARIESVVVENVFNDDPPASIGLGRNEGASPEARWELFTVSSGTTAGASGVGGALFLPATAGFREESAPLEEVHFCRDEGANLVWAIEHVVPDGTGKPISGFDAQAERRRNELAAAGVAPVAPVAATEAPAYRLQSLVPANWIPYIPVDAQIGLALAQRSIRLQQARMLRNDGGAPTRIEPMSILLTNGGRSAEWINEEAVPRSGVRVQLTSQRVRWVDGKTYVWRGRKVVAGGGEGSSGLRFDYLRGDP